MKRAIILFWHGLTGIFCGIANWFTTILGMNDNSKYGKLIRRTVGTCFALLMLMLTFCAGTEFFDNISYKFQLFEDDDDECWISERLSRNVSYYFSYNSGANNGYVMTSSGKKTITGIDWISRPLGDDSLVFYKVGDKRGYFNMYTGEPVIEARYQHAWVFSDGLAAVDDNGWIKFIDATGKVVIDPKLQYGLGKSLYVFHDGYCVMPDKDSDHVGLMDKNGNWALEPCYSSISNSDSLWLLSRGEEMALLSASLDTIIPFMEADIFVCGDYIRATMPDHTMRGYDKKGNLITDFYVSEVSQLTYNTSELYYPTTKCYDDEGNETGETTTGSPEPVMAVASCMRYQAEYGWYGLMTSDGRILTPPAYSNIEAVGQDLYLCSDEYENGVIINGKGEKVE